jgi:hypothetical protein
MILARRGVAFRVSLVAWYVAAVLGWLVALMFEGAAWSDPVFILFLLAGLAAVALALDGTMLIVARGDTLHVLGVIRRARLRRDSCRFVVRRTGMLRSGSHSVLLTDGRRERVVCHYWMWGDLLAARAVARLERSLLKD